MCNETKFWRQSVSGNHHTVFMRRFDETLILFTYAQLLKKYSIIYKTAPKIQNCPQTSLHGFRRSGCRPVWRGTPPQNLQCPGSSSPQTRSVCTSFFFSDCINPCNWTPYRNCTWDTSLEALLPALLSGGNFLGGWRSYTSLGAVGAVTGLLCKGYLGRRVNGVPGLGVRKSNPMLSLNAW